ncbi:MAG: SLC45 family MFS transporter [Anaerofustis stercorihominis]|nr:SLC45 family MFS transporter [Anaerofustis stercorihominis]
MKLNYKRTFVIGLVFFSITMMASLHDSLTPKILYSFGVGETLIGIIMAVDNVFAIAMMPLFGYLSDRTNSKYGKRTPFFFVGTILASVFLIMLPIADNMRNLPLFIACLFGFLLSLATYRSPGVSVMSDVTPKPLRSKANGVINLMGTLAGIVGIVLTSLFYKERILEWEYNAIGDKVPVLGANGLPILDNSVNNIGIYIAVAAIAIIAMLIYVFSVNENKLVKEREEIEKQLGIIQSDESGESQKQKLSPEEKKSLILILFSISLWFFGYNAVITFFSNYATTVLGIEGGGFSKYLLVANVGGVIAFIPAGIVAGKLGRKKTILTGVAILTTAFASGIFFTKETPLLYGLFMLAGIGWATINVNSLPMITEFAQSSNIGQFTGYYYFASMSAQTLTPVISGFLIENLSIGYRVLFIYATVFVALSALPISFSKHGDSLAVNSGSILERFEDM